jgi:ADP-ribosylglycohydrolase/fructose-1,6-bisphosphatase/inositol monophosphatase family enzyme
MSGPYETELAVAVAAAREAGALLRAELHRPGGPRGRGAHADADVEAERIIRERLRAATRFSYVGEELGETEGDDPSHVWLVDPNDGTAAFLEGHRGTAVSIALIRRGTPVIGVVYAYAYPDDDGDLHAWAEGSGPLTRNGRAVTSSLAGAALARSAVILVSQAADARSLENARCVAPARYLAMPSVAYRLALVAAGEGIAGVSLSGATAWDYAGGHALVGAARGELVDQSGRTVGYGERGGSATGWCFGGSVDVARALAKRPWDSVFRAEEPGAAAPYGLLRPAIGRLVRDAGALRRAQGCLLGQLAGDALGSRVEFQHPARILAGHPDGVRDLADGGTWDTIAGQPTDDSEMALMLARSIALHGGYDPGAALDAYVHWYRSAPFDMGGTTRAALGAASRGATRAERLELGAASAKQESEANGSLMRASPLGILGAHRPAEAAASARADSGLTHPNPVCREACAAFVAAIAAAIGKGAGPEGAHEAACAEAARGGNEPVQEALSRARNAPPASFTHHEGWVLIALQNAFYRLLHAPSLEEGVIATVMEGGDTDTNAAIAGALLGAVHGREAVPARWRRQVLTCRPLREVGAKQARPPEFWPVDAMVLAEALLAIGAPIVIGASASTAA